MRVVTLLMWALVAVWVLIPLGLLGYTVWSVYETYVQHGFLIALVERWSLMLVNGILIGVHARVTFFFQSLSGWLSLIPRFRGRTDPKTEKEHSF